LKRGTPHREESERLGTTNELLHVIIRTCRLGVLDIKIMIKNKGKRKSGTRTFFLYTSTEHEIHIKNVRFQVLTAVSIKMAVFWVVTPYSLVEVY
jgi:hypothetical protein